MSNSSLFSYRLAVAFNICVAQNKFALNVSTKNILEINRARMNPSGQPLNQPVHEPSIQDMLKFVRRFELRKYQRELTRFKYTNINQQKEILELQGNSRILNEKLICLENKFHALTTEKDDIKMKLEVHKKFIDMVINATAPKVETTITPKQEPTSTPKPEPDTTVKTELEDATINTA